MLVYKLYIANNNCFLGVHGLCFYIINILTAFDRNWTNDQEEKDCNASPFLTSLVTLEFLIYIFFSPSRMFYHFNCIEIEFDMWDCHCTKADAVFQNKETHLSASCIII